jgi:hypothetical protein
MARVRSAGGIATLHHIDHDDGNEVHVVVRLFAKLDDGMLAIDRDPVSLDVGVPAGQLATLHDAVVTALRFGELPEEERQSYWGGVVEELRETFSVRTDPETLMSLPFDLVPDGELRGLLERR